MGAPIYFGTDPGSPNLSYLAGYAPGCHGYLVFPLHGAPTLLVYVPNHYVNARALSVVEDVVAGNDLIGSAVQRISDLDFEVKRIGVVGNFAFSGSSIPVEHDKALRYQLPSVTFETVTTWYEDIRLRKSDEEMAAIRAGAAICDQAHEALREKVRPGVKDVELQNEVFRVVHELGGRLPFSHVGSTSMHRPTLRYPNFYAINRTIEHGDAVLTEIAAGKGGYFGKIYGTLTVGKPLAPYETMLELAIEIYHDVYSAVEPGMRAGSIETVLAGRTESAGVLSLSYISGWSTYNTRPTKTTSGGQVDRDLELSPGHCLNLAGLGCQL